MALEFMLCLNSLISAPNAPVQRRAEKVSSVVLRILQLRHMKIGELQKAAFSIINNIFQRIQTENMAVAKKLTRALVPLLSHWWQPRSLSRDAMLNSIRDEMLKAIYAIHLYLEALLRESPDDPLFQETEDLLDALWSEYSRRDDRSRLQLEDISFTAMRLPSDHPRTAVFCLRPYNVAGEQNWALLENLALLEAIYLRTSHGDRSHAQPDVDQPRKKRRTAGSIPNRLHQKMISIDPAVQLTALQLVPFLSQLRKLSADDINQVLADVARCTPRKPSLAASWGILAYARYFLFPLCPT